MRFTCSSRQVYSFTFTPSAKHTVASNVSASPKARANNLKSQALPSKPELHLMQRGFILSCPQRLQCKVEPSRGSAGKS